MDPAQHRSLTVSAYERLAGVWGETDDNLFNEALERATVRSMLTTAMLGGRVLDAGCAAGAHSAWLCEAGCEVVAFDLSRAMVTAAAARCGGAAQFVIADLAAPPFVDGAFDGVVCSLALHYLEDIATTLRAFARMVHPDGWVLVTLDHPFGAMAAEPEPAYFSTRLVADTWIKRGVQVTQYFWRRPLGVTIDAFADAGLRIERIGEPRVDEVMRERFGDEADAIDGQPTFIAYLARPAGAP